MANPSVAPGLDPALVRSRIESERRRLQKASAVLSCAILAVEREIDIEVLGDAIAAGRELVDAAIIALDSVSLSKLVNDSTVGAPHA
jgi:hypothetical protein